MSETSEYNEFAEAARSKIYTGGDEFVPIGKAFGAKDDDGASIGSNASIIAAEVGEHILNMEETKNRKILDQYERDMEYIILPPKQRYLETKLLFRTAINLEIPYSEIIKARMYLWAFIWGMKELGVDGDHIGSLKNSHNVLNEWKLSASEKSKTLSGYINSVIVPTLMC